MTFNYATSLAWIVFAATVSTQVAVAQVQFQSGPKQVSLLELYTAQSVCLVGDFNGWNPFANRMRRRVDGWWSVQVQLTHGHHRYCFLVDGEPTLDPVGAGITRNDRNEPVSLIAVS